jgi:hypothetical protein
MKFAEHAARITDLNNPANILLNTLESKRLFGRPRCTVEDHIKINLRNYRKWLYCHTEPSHSSMKIGHKTVEHIAIQLEMAYLHLQ